MIDFDDFINSNDSKFNFDKNYVSFDTIFDCSYINYFVIEHINGEIDNIFCVEFNDLVKYIYGPYLIFALNHLDNILIEVKKL